jgi:hypothetical protein
MVTRPVPFEFTDEEEARTRRLAAAPQWVMDRSG